MPGLKGTEMPGTNSSPPGIRLSLPKKCVTSIIQHSYGRARGVRSTWFLSLIHSSTLRFVQSGLAIRTIARLHFVLACTLTRIQRRSTKDHDSTAPVPCRKSSLRRGSPTWRATVKPRAQIGSDDVLRDRVVQVATARLVIRNLGALLHRASCKRGQPSLRKPRRPFRNHGDSPTHVSV